MKLLFGWSLKQWALVLGQIKEKPRTLRDALKIKNEYMKRNAYAPPEQLTIIIKGNDPRPCNFETALVLFGIPN